MKFIKTLLVMMCASVSIYAQDTLKIKTSVQCDDCKEIIEHDLSFERGIKSATVDVDSKLLTVVYNADKTNPDKIRTAVTKIGYDADSMPADQKAYRKLKTCCKKESAK